jgi:hypothetical protein
LNPEETLRIVIPSATLLVLGLQIIFSSCLLSILQLEMPAPVPPDVESANARAVEFVAGR